MLYAENTPNNLGVTLSGDQRDFDELYDSLHRLIGEEGEYEGFDAARIRILGFCYDLRHALMGDREYSFVDSGLDDHKKRTLGVLGPEKNLNLSFNTLWPEMHFVMLALNDFIILYMRHQKKTSFKDSLFRDPRLCWDKTVANVRMLQSAVSECLREILTEKAYAGLMNAMNGRYASSLFFTTQYIDLLNIRFIKMKKDKRLKSISAYGKRIAKQDDEYWDLTGEFRQAAKEHGTHILDLRLNMEYPEEMEW